MTKSWKTTLGGILLALGTPLSQVASPQWVHLVGVGMLTVSGLFLAQARDNKVSSEEAGIK